jgi:hypothetical protein
MLKVFLGDMDNVIFNTSVYFKYNYQPSWLEDPDVVQMIFDIDKSVVLGNGAVESPVMGVIAPASLSGGVKTLILIDKVPEKVFNASNCGDNCAAWLLRIGSKKDVAVNLRHIMEFGEEDFEIYVMNTKTVVHNMDEFIAIAGRYV